MSAARAVPDLGVRKLTAAEAEICRCLLAMSLTAVDDCLCSA